MGAAFVGGDGFAPVRRHAEECRRGQDHARRFSFTAWAILRIVAFGHRPHVRERTAIVAEIFVDGHWMFLARNPFEWWRWMRGGRYAPSRILRAGIICPARSASGYRR